MQATVDLLVKQYFSQDKLDHLSEQDILDFIDQHPYASWGKILLALKKKSVGASFEKEAGSAAMHMNNPLWLYAVMEGLQKEKEKEKEKEKGKEIVREEEQKIMQEKEVLSDGLEQRGVETQEQTVATLIEADTQNETEDQNMAKPAEFRPIPKPEETSSQPAIDEPIVFEPYHTIDYFASQGIKLSADDLTKDKFGRQLKSFTEWLRSMKKIPQGAQLNISSSAETTVDQSILEKADASVETSEVDTEAMAEVWAKQGKKTRAIEIYQKLSLLNPSKSHYFAAKIDQLNA